MTASEAYDLAKELDGMLEDGHEVSAWEADFLETVMERKGERLSAKQLNTLSRMADKYRMKGWLA
jgi:hypothetical protein